MKQFIAKFKDQIQGVLSGLDRVLFRGSLRRLAHSLGMKQHPLQTVRRPREGHERRLY